MKSITEESRLQALVTALTTLPQVQGAAQRVVIRTINTLNRTLADRKRLPGQLSALARRILSHCSTGEQLSTKTIARACRVSPTSGHLFAALNELKKSGHLKKLDKGLYQVEIDGELRAVGAGAENSSEEIA